MLEFEPLFHSDYSLQEPACKDKTFHKSNQLNYSKCFEIFCSQSGVNLQDDAAVSFIITLA